MVAIGVSGLVIALSHIAPTTEVPSANNTFGTTIVDVPMKPTESRIIDFPYDGTGRYLVIQIRDYAKLALCEVKVFGSGRTAIKE
jgi:hypothetical protein